MTRSLRSATFWAAFVITGLLTGLLFAWETNLLSPMLHGPVRPPATGEELLFTGVIVFLIACDSGLFFWRKRYGTCPSGIRRATGIAAFFGGLALLCPACTILPITLLGMSIGLGFFTPFLPLLRMITIIILVVVTAMLWPPNEKKI